MGEEGLASGVGARMPWETVRDWFHEAGNYVDPLDRAAEALAGEIAGTEAVSEAALARRLTTEGISIAESADEEAPIRSFDAARGLLTINAALPVESRRFRIAHPLTATVLATQLTAIVAVAHVASDSGRPLPGAVLANYEAGALMMPYSG